MEFILTCKSNNSCGYVTTIIDGRNLIEVAYEYDPEDIISIVRVF
jgi:hypothetical protein